MNRSILLVPLFSGLIVSCGDDPDNELLYAATFGIVQGEVWDGTTWSPIAGATVELHDGAEVRSATTGADGRFVIADVPAGSNLAVDFTADGFARARGDVFIDDEAGENPQENSIAEITALLWPSTAAVAIVVFDGTTGDPVPGIGVVARHSDAFAFDDLTLLDVPQGESDADGQVLLSGLAQGQTYDIVTLANDDYGSSQALLDAGEDNSILINIFALNQLCDGFPEPCCNALDSCGLAGDFTCQCSDCGWDAFDCGGV